MRFRKAKGNKKAVVTLTESEIVEACQKYLAEMGISTGQYCWMRIDLNKDVKRRGRRVEFVSEIE
jgi:hypothetical protein